MNKSFGKLLIESMRLAGVSVDELAREVGVERSTILRWRTGQVKRPRYRSDVLRCAQPLKLTPEETDKLLSAAGFRPEHDAQRSSEVPLLFRKAGGLLTGLDTATLVCHLEEWKIIHSTVQELLISTSSITLQTRGKLTEKVAFSIENDWLRFCEPKVNRIERSFSQLKFVNHPSVDQLSLLLKRDSDQYLVRRIRDLEITNPDSIRRLQSSVYELIDMLEEVLTLADLYILEIVRELAHAVG
jgi:transcriptional regulator with XRE-family HTH domain